ncbi:double-stranded RNA-specific editase 1-like isoform X8 [Panulirus ornatus]|uniref:double-stranded RNA-specific editase 1-like isoform X8 n=1 Tax=Panulirus ornatus TaxID=150431 RepID=UPI003A8BF3AE
MRGRGRGRGNWRSGAAAAGADTANTENFTPPANNEQPAPVMDFYQQGRPAAPADVKMDVANEVHVSDSDTSMHEGEQQQETRKRPWEKLGGVKVKRKKVPGAKNLKIRRYVQPKNAVMCLNELRPGVTYNTEQEGGVGQPFCISVEVDGQKYRGFGSSKQLAKQASAEAALISFVKPPVTSTENAEEDKTPWATLASFAIYKLFNDWREGRVGTCPPPSQAYGTALPPAFLNQNMGANSAVKEEPPQATAFTEAITAHLGGRTTIAPVADGKVPENAANMHPVMVLHQMKPGLQYNVNQTSHESKPFFTVSVELDGKEFTGEGPNVKKAKFFLAKEAIQGLYGIESTFQTPA